MPTNRKYIRRPQRLPLSATQEMELWLGPGRDGTAFASDEHRREAWFRYRDRLMQRWAKGGRRSLGWWWYEASERGLPPRHPALHERSILYEFSDVLSAEERAELEAEWRKEFDRTWDTNFSFYADGKYYTGDVARELAWIAIDLPMVLHDKFMAERKRRGRTIRELEEESSTGQQQSR